MTSIDVRPRSQAQSAVLDDASDSHVLSLRLELKQWESEWAAAHGGRKPTRDDVKNNPEIANKYKEYNRLKGRAKPISISLAPTKGAPHDMTRQTKRKAAHDDDCNEDHCGKENHPPCQERHKDSCDRRTGPCDSDTNEGRTPVKRFKHSQNQTPGSSARGRRFGGADMTPISGRKLFSPSASNLPTSIGPTPHREGKVLGLFDMLDMEEPQTQALGETPSKRSGKNVSNVLAPGPGSGIVATPRKSSNGAGAEDDLEEDATRLRLGKTPMSSGRRRYLDMFVTPKAKRKGLLFAASARKNDVIAEEDETGSAGQKEDDDSLDGLAKMFQTPEFLRREKRVAAFGVGETQSQLSGTSQQLFRSPSAKLRLPRKPMGRTLSSMVASLRKMEDDKLDEEMELMREMEMEMDMGAPKPGASRSAIQRSKSMPTNTKFVEATSPAAHVPANRETEASPIGNGESCAPTNAQTLAQEAKKANDKSLRQEMLAADTSPHLLGGFDDEGMFDSGDEEPQLDRGRPMRVFKKKGQKRTTRKVNMKPMRVQRPSTTKEHDEEDSEDELAGPVTKSVEHKEEPGDGADDACVAVDELSGSEFEHVEGSEDNVEDDSASKGNLDKKKKAAYKSNKSTTAVGPATRGKDKDKDKDKGNDAESTKKRPAKKVNELAHANFRALKLRKKGGGGGGGAGGRRFGRRR